MAALVITANDPVAKSLKAAIQKGDAHALRSLLDSNAELARAWISDRTDPRQLRSLLHIATDWPGNYANGAETVALLAAAGADVNARFVGPHTETALHWAASCDDVAVLDALLDSGAEIEALGAVLGGGTALADAVGFGQWKAARRLVERGASTTLSQAAALGLLERCESTLNSASALDRQVLTEALWYACHGGQQPTAALMLAKGADASWVGWDELTPLGAAKRSGAAALVDWLLAAGVPNEAGPR
jgi:uncharacterized protein